MNVLLFFTDKQTQNALPDVRRASAEIKAEFDEAVSERQWDEVATWTLDVTVVENKSIMSSRLNDHFNVSEWQNITL